MKFSTVLMSVCLIFTTWTLSRVNGDSIVTTNSSQTDIDSKAVKDEILFEGDIKLSKQIIMECFNFSSVPGGSRFLAELKGNLSSTENITSLSQRQKRGAGRSINLWPNGIVYYRISSSIPYSTAQLIREAMDHWEDHTCLRFFPGRGRGNYIDIANSDAGCYSHVGMTGRRQTINLQLGRCNSKGTILHEIGHSVGFWHEHNRPDRDNYVTINFGNIQTNSWKYFMKHTDTEINSLGSKYDYRSIMHYRNNAFKRSGCGNNCKTITINNIAEYIRQGRPTLGTSSSSVLSTEDIKQANILYVCPGIGEHGFLIFRARYGVSLRDTDFWGYPDPYIQFTAVDSSGNHYRRSSSVKSGTRNPSWNQWVDIGYKKWYFFRVKVWDSDGWWNSDDAMTLSETFTVKSGNHYSVKHCENTACNGYVIFDYRLITPRRGKLQFNIRYARSLRDTDPIWNNPDPYVQVRVKYMYSTGTSSLQTSYISGTTNPTWNQQLNFACTSYAYFEIQVWDEDGGFTGADDPMSDKELVFVQPGYHSKRHNAHGSGYLIYNYNFVLDRNNCFPNPCRNSGTCADLCSDYRCNCRSGYSGKNCEYRTGSLSVYARYGWNLPDSDGWWNDSDPYMMFIAIDQNGNSVTRTTYAIRGTQNPSWYQNLSFGKRAWKWLQVRVYDQDSGSDDALSNWRTITLSNPPSSRSFFTHNCHKGYAVFDYSYNL